MLCIYCISRLRQLSLLIRSCTWMDARGHSERQSARDKGDRIICIGEISTTPDTSTEKGNKITYRKLQVHDLHEAFVAESCRIQQTKFMYA